MRCLICFLAFYFSTNIFGYSQDVALKFAVNQESKQIKKQTYSFSNTINNDLAILVRERKNSVAFLYDKHFKAKSKFDFIFKKKSKYNTVLGEKIVGSQYSLLYANRLKNKFCVFTVDFSTNSSSLKELKINFKNERYLKTIAHKNKLYLLSFLRADNEIIIRELNDAYEFELIKSHALELDKNQKLYTPDSSINNFWNTVQPDVVTIDNRIPNSIEQVSENNKIYVQNDSLYITFDNTTESTLMYVINLINFSINKIKFDYPKGRIAKFEKYNSYFFDNKLFQIASSRKEVLFEVKNLNNDILKSYYFDKGTPIDIKNSPIIQDGQTAIPFVNKREFEETSKFLRKISSGNLGISVYKKDDFYHITIGGVKQVIYSNPAPMIMGGPTVVTINNQVHLFNAPNPVFASYQSFKSSKSTYFNTKLDLDFNYVEAVVDKNIFENIEEFHDRLNNVSGEAVFFHSKHLYFSYFDAENSEFNLVKF